MANESNIKKRISLSWLASAAPNNSIHFLSYINDRSKGFWLNSQGESQSVFFAFENNERVAPLLADLCYHGSIEVFEGNWLDNNLERIK